jgi:peptide/nickel transport system substrate-binding protein
VSDESERFERMSRRQVLYGAGAMAVGLGLAACGGGDDDGDDTTTAAAPTSAADTGGAATSAAAEPATTGGAATTAGGATSAADTSAATTAAAPAGTPGGTFRVGLTGGSAKDIVDGQNIVNKPDQARLLAGWDTLVTYDRDYKLVNDGLAEELTAEAPDTYVIRLKEGIEFHDGKTVGADDVIYSIKRLIDPELGLFGGAALASVDPNQITKVDERTVRLKLKQPDSTIPDSLAQYVAGIVPDGYTNTGKSMKDGQIGTGAYILESFTPGQESRHSKNPNYWREGQPFFDEVVVIDFPDDKARVNALLAGQVDAITDVPFAQVSVVEGNSGLKILESEGGGWLPLCMAVDQEPFTDPRVRQAFRLIVNRDEMVQQALAGHGRVANDLYGVFDACYPTDLPQRTQDLEQAKALLAEAGKEGLTIDLQTTNGGTGMVESAKVFAQQAKGAGVTVNVKVLDGGTFYGDQYLKWTFSSDFWGTRSYLAQVAAGSLPSSPYNETHWPPAGSNFEELYKQALAETDEAARCEIVRQMAQMEYDEGGYIIPFFNNLVDAYSTKVTGFLPNRGTLNLDSFGRGYTAISFA